MISIFKALYKAFIYSFNGMKIILFDRPFLQELILIGIPTILAFFLPLEIIWKVLLLQNFVIILVVEALNTAIEILANRVCQDFDILIKKTKDVASFAVLICIIFYIALYVFALTLI